MLGKLIQNIFITRCPIDNPRSFEIPNTKSLPPGLPETSVVFRAQIISQLIIKLCLSFTSCFFNGIATSILDACWSQYRLTDFWILTVMLWRTSLEVRGQGLRLEDKDLKPEDKDKDLQIGARGYSRTMQGRIKLSGGCANCKWGPVSSRHFIVLTHLPRGPPHL